MMMRSGITLVELLVSLGVIAVIMAASCCQQYNLSMNQRDLCSARITCGRS
jgi:prepilin-type N-terminal cleavage/methylation domain-containing protein